MERNTFFRCLLSVQGTGAALAAALFLLCLVLVHLFKLARIGYRTHAKKLPPEEPKKEEQEPVYYIVERKKKRARTEYSQPKRIHFK